MNFALTDEQQLLRETAASLLASECPPSLVRAHADDPSVADALFDRHLREWSALGAGPLTDLCLFQEEAGAVLLPGPFFAHAALFVPLLAAMEHELAPAATAGEVVGTVALAGASGRWEPNDDPVRTFVPDVDRVDRVALVTGRDGEVRVALVEAGELSARPVATLDSTRRVFEVDVPAAVPDSAVAPEVVTRAVQQATVALAAELVGVSRWLNQTTVAYSRERVQFGRPIGSFQGLQFAMVDLSLEHERAAAAVAYAAMALDADDPDRTRAVHVAKAAAGTAGRRAARVGLQVHGGIGYTWEHDLHLYLRRAYASDDLLGDAAHHHDRLAALLLDPPEPSPTVFDA